MEELERHHEHREYLKRVPKINKNKYKINDIDYLKFKIRNN